MRTKPELLSELQTMLRDVFAAASGGTAYARIARAHGYVDGFMRALLDMGVVQQRELVELVAAAPMASCSVPAVASMYTMRRAPLASTESDESSPTMCCPSEYGAPLCPFRCRPSSTTSG